MSDALSIRRQRQLVLSGTGPCPESFDAIIIEILSWLPVKSLLRFRCVCKAWRALISQSYFIKKHLIRTEINASFKLLVKESFVFRSIEYQALFNCLSDDGTIPHRELDFPEINLPMFEFLYMRIIGACNGLICLLLDCETSTIMLWNPCTRDSQVLPQPPIIHRDLRFFGFGYDSTTDDYKVVLGCWNSSYESVIVFTLKTGSWRKLQSLTKYFRVLSIGRIVNEALHWLLYEPFEQPMFCPSRIVSFDLAEEKFHEIAFPYPPNPIDRCTLVADVETLGNCLTLYFQTMDCRAGCEMKIWVMKEYGVKESWAEVINIPSGILGERYSFMRCISENGEVLMRLGSVGPLAIYNPKEKTFRILLHHNHEAFYDTATYVETLVSPFIGSSIGTSM
ncbi:putative F-box domain, galactose oxidase/kelch, beta-propeller, F-box associated interaction [Rosa chinensis]|uniref:Putative F-box domain, galactose oxidase/kelch, beta-propeller, F-box associated interaction n=1 Tax=Rosa chinensis TaxID=74649 RepID=A0A2P6S105_ROSCH|nr:F-box/kelch-repeat protein At3g23880 [Rosa chinensis]PRQ52368.1 putative F-box domain, galactose oxidase/kelch, beta-propeller, F-box associated interaction [Rosa chinensis]